jgi:TolA-binding protein
MINLDLEVSAIGSVGTPNSSFEMGDLYGANSDYGRELLFLSNQQVLQILGELPKQRSNSYQSKHINSDILDSKAFLIQINILIAKNKLADAKRLINKFLLEDENYNYFPFAHFLKGNILYDEGEYSEASESYEFALSASDKLYHKTYQSNYSSISHIAKFRKALSLAASGAYSVAGPVLEMVASDGDKFSDDALFMIAQIQENLGNSKSAVESYKRVRTEFPHSNNYLSSLIRQANMNLVLRNPGDAIANLERAKTLWRSFSAGDSLTIGFEEQINLESSLEQIIYLRAEASNLSKNYSEAVNYFTSFLETFSSSPLSSHVLLGRAWAYLNLKGFEKSLGDYNHIISKQDSKNNQENWKIIEIAELYRALCYKLSGDLKSAKKEFSELIIRSNYSFVSLALLELGQINFEAKDFDISRKMLERAERESFDVVTSTRIYLLLGAVYLELQKWEKAVATYQKAENLSDMSSLEIMPDKEFYLNESRYKKGIAHIRAGRSALAIAPLSAFISEERDSVRRAEAMFWLSESYYRSDMLVNAEKAYSALLEKYPNCSRREDALYGLGWSHFRRKKFSQSAKVYQRLVAEFPGSDYAVEVLAREADGYYLIKNYAKASEVYGRVARHYPKSGEGEYSAYQHCHSLYRLGRYDEAINNLYNFVRKYRNSQLAPNAMFLIGWIRFSEEKFSEAIDSFRFLIDAYPNSGYIAKTYFTIANAYYNQNKYEEAIPIYRTVVESYPTSPLAPEAMRSVQQCLILLGRGDEAIEIIDVYTGKNENSPFVYDFMNKKAKIQFESARYGEAVTEYEKIIKKYPGRKENAEAIYWIGRSYQSTGDLAEAESAFNRIVTRFPKSRYAPLGMLKLGMMHKRMNDPEKADSVLKYLEDTWSKSMAAPEAGFERALIKYTLGDTVNAIEIYKHVAYDYTNNDFSVEAGHRLGAFYKRRGENDSARTHYARLAAQDFNLDFAAEAQYRTGELWKKDGRDTMALNAFLVVKEKFSMYDDWYTLSLLNIGELSENMKNWELAREVYSIIIELRPSDDFGKTAIRRMKNVTKNLPKEDEIQEGIPEEKKLETEEQKK